VPPLGVRPAHHQNIVATELNAKCSVPWSGPGSSPKCCTSDLTLAEFKSLRAKMDASVPSAATAQGYLGGTPSWRTDLYTGRGTLMTLRESIALNERNGVKHTPELKGGDPARINQIFGSQAKYAQEIQYALDIKAAGLKIITWTFERADLRKGAAQAGFYYYFDPQGTAIKKDSDMYEAPDALAKQVGIIGVFSDWPATVTYYANCMGLK